MAATTYKKYYKITCDSFSSRFHNVLRIHTLSHRGGQSFFFFFTFLSRVSYYSHTNSHLAPWKSILSGISVVDPREREILDLPVVCVSEIYNNRVCFCYTANSRVVLPWSLSVQNRKNAPRGSKMRAQVRLCMYVSRSLQRQGRRGRLLDESPNRSMMWASRLLSINYHIAPACMHTFTPSFYGHMHMQITY